MHIPAAKFVLICGSRDLKPDQRPRVEAALKEARELLGTFNVVQGGATGADALGAEVADAMGLHVWTEHADWKRHGRAAGPIRNQAMLDRYKPCLVIAFSSLSHILTRGTADMVQRAQKAGLDTWLDYP
jgi:hypothetical protein